MERRPAAGRGRREAAGDHRRSSAQGAALTSPTPVRLVVTQGIPWQVVLERPFGAGTLTAVQLPEGPAPVSDEVLARLAPAEQELVRSARGFRKKQLAGGRLAAGHGLRAAGLPDGPVTSGERGAPCWPAGCRGSLAHKDRLAVAWVEPRHDDATLGIDIEELAAKHPSLAGKVLTDSERRSWEVLPAAQQRAVLVRSFAVKEAVYKALAPRLHRYVSFHEAEVSHQDDGAIEVRLALRCGEGPFEVAAEVLEMIALDRFFVIATVRLQPGKPLEEAS